MVTIRRANVILEIPDDEAVIAKYLSTGFDVIDESGKVIKKSTHGKGEADLRKELEELQTKYDKLVKENKTLTAKLDALVADSEPEEEVVQEQPKKRRSTKSKD